LSRLPARLVGPDAQEPPGYLAYEWNLDLRRLGVPRDAFGSAMITNIGSLGLESAFAPLIPYSRVPLILALGAVEDTPVVDGDRVVPGKTMRVCATFDHRLLDGAHAARMARVLRAPLRRPVRSLRPAARTVNAGGATFVRRPGGDLAYGRRPCLPRRRPPARCRARSRSSSPTRRASASRSTGMRNILTTFLAAAFFSHLTKDDAKGQAKDIFHVFVIGVYFFPLIGGWLSDRFFGKYRTILFVSLLYCVGHALLAIFEDEPNGFYLGLMLIAIGAGGIKPLVSTFMGDQFDQTNKVKAKLAFEMFYWSVNFGSFFASLFMPRLLRGDGPANWWGLTPASVAFGIPGILMGIAVIAFWLGRKRYVIVPPAPPDPNAFSRVVRTALLARGGAVPSAHVVGGGADDAGRAARADAGDRRPDGGPGRARGLAAVDQLRRQGHRHGRCAWPWSRSWSGWAAAPGSSSSAPAACTLTRRSTACAASCACW
jgi:hypothetical protein